MKEIYVAKTVSRGIAAAKVLNNTWKCAILLKIEYEAVRCQNNDVGLSLVLVKRETGGNPVRTRHRN